MSQLILMYEISTETILASKRNMTRLSNLSGGNFSKKVHYSTFPFVNNSRNKRLAYPSKIGLRPDRS